MTQTSSTFCNFAPTSKLLDLRSDITPVTNAYIRTLVLYKMLQIRTVS